MNLNLDGTAQARSNFLAIRIQQLTTTNTTATSILSEMAVVLVVVVLYYINSKKSSSALVEAHSKSHGKFIKFKGEGNAARPFATAEVPACAYNFVVRNVLLPLLPRIIN